MVTGPAGCPWTGVSDNDDPPSFPISVSPYLLGQPPFILVMAGRWLHPYVPGFTPWRIPGPVPNLFLSASDNLARPSSIWRRDGSQGWGSLPVRLWLWARTTGVEG